MSTTLASPRKSATTWTLDQAHSVAEFKVRHMMITNVKGYFSVITGRLSLDDQDVTRSHVKAEIESASIDTRNSQRDTHLKSADFFDVENHPTLAFTSTRVQRHGSDELSVEGDLTLRGVTRPVVFAVDGSIAPAIDPWGNTRMGLSAKTKIDRKDFGLTWNAALETGGVLVGDEVTITLELQFLRADAPRE
jgi:polyisoprenoid-binding protein YceI